ncbi:PD-(D/E)XK nuclease family protein [Streptomyces argyrophyllae]|uniref:PD-(D/E)XK nuclease family protein n=1 Tax=Streptomyces argyrophylli TaxID=2726118 RepID=A0A6M4PJH2_9ACTN|nr:PD-(D/E)XK nuclease family protein [Streptomyces argyrophyllae]
MSVENQPRSVSQVEQYEKCAWRWYLQRVERVEPRPAAWSFHGTAFHTAAEAWERSSRRMEPEEVVDIFRDEYTALVNKALDKEPDTDLWLAAGRYTGGEDIERRYNLGIEHTRAYVEWSRNNEPAIWTEPTDGGPALELYFMVELGGIKVRGYIDQVIKVKDGVRPRDLKTGSTKSKFQLQTYGIALRELYGLEVNDADWYLARDGRLSRPVKLDQVSADELGERYAAMDAGVKRGDFPASPGFDCRFCDMAHACFFSAKT